MFNKGLKGSFVVVGLQSYWFPKTVGQNNNSSSHTEVQPFINIETSKARVLIIRVTMVLMPEYLLSVVGFEVQNYVCSTYFQKTVEESYWREGVFVVGLRPRGRQP